MFRSTTTVALTALAAILFSLAVVGGTEAQGPDTTTREWVNFGVGYELGFDPFAFTETEPGSGIVRKVSLSDPADTPLSSVTSEGVHVTPDNLFEGDTTAPIGDALGLTLGDWLAATGTVSVTCSGDTSTLDATFSGLIASGVYTVWDVRVDAVDPSIVTAFQPLGAADGSEATVVVDGAGNATYHVELAYCLTGQSDILELDLLYHYDGATYGPLPTHTESGDLGVEGAVQLIVVYEPAAADAAPMAPTSGSAGLRAEEGGGINQLLLLSALAAACVVAATAGVWAVRRSRS